MDRKIKGKQINLRQIRKSDTADHVSWFKDRSITRNTLIPYPYNSEHYRLYLNFQRAARRRGELMHYGIEDPESGRIVGGISLSDISRNHRKAELGYWLAKPFRRRGFTSEAAQLMLRLGFRQLKLVRIYAPVFTRNEASAELLLKNGFTREGRLRKTIKKDNRYLDEYIFSILKDEWRG